MGQAEAGSLRWCDVDWPDEQMITFRHKTRPGFAVPIYPHLRPLLERLRDARPEGSPSDGPVFKIIAASLSLPTTLKEH